MDLIDKYLIEATPTKMKCMECGKDFKKKIGKKTVEVKCPKCGSYDTEPTGYGK
jgi:Zn finger protein HypA/HybF involved in hydrogenase expression